jgi:hypothetical protein
MKIKVIKDSYMIFCHLLVVGDVWESRIVDGYEFFECIEGEWLEEESDGWWEYEGYEDYFEVIE